jgi:hypothetical protein
MKKETRGRKTILTPELTERVVDLIKQGLTQKDACNLAGLAYSTYNEWKAKGDKDIEPFAEFFSVTSRARNEFKRLLVRLVLAGTQGGLPKSGDWRGAAWLLAKNFPLQYGDRPLPPLPAPAEEPKAAPLVMQLVLSTPDGKKRETTFAEAQEILCGGFPIRNEPPDESELGNGGINIGPRFNP